MARVAKVVPGSIINGLQYMNVVPSATVGWNKRITAQCVTCKTEKLMWLSAFMGGRSGCPDCKSLRRKSSAIYGLDLASRTPLAVLHPNGPFKIIWDSKIIPEEVHLPEGAVLYIARNNETFKPWTVRPERVIYESTAIEVKPEPEDYPLHLIVPAKYIPYYLGEDSSLSKEDELAAQAYYDEYVKQKNPDVYSEHTRGLTAPWLEGATHMAYLYFKDDFSCLVA